MSNDKHPPDGDNECLVSESLARFLDDVQFVEEADRTEIIEETSSSLHGGGELATEQIDEAAPQSGEEDVTEVHTGLPATGEADGTAIAGPVSVLVPVAKPQVFVGPGALQDNINTAEALLASTGYFFLHHGSVVVVHRDVKTGEISLRLVRKQHVLIELDGLADWMKPARDQWVPAHPPDKVCTGLIEARTHRHLADIRGVARQPFLRPDGSLVQQAGYDRTTGIYGEFIPEDFNVPEAPTIAEARDAMVLLEGLLEEFPFRSPIDRSSALSALLTAAVRVSLDAAPMFHVRAHQPGTGKSYLCRLTAAFASKRTARAVTFPSSDVECGKVLLAALKDAPEVIEFDNLTADLVPHESLCSVLTAEQYSGRILGYSEMKTVSTRSLVLSSGNNVGPVGDMTRRCIMINLDAGCELPAARKFNQPSILEDLLKDRASAVSAALTVVRAWHVAGRSDLSTRPIASFGQWSSNCRLPLIWLGYPDPAEAVFTAMAEDPERTLIGRLLKAMREQFGDRGAMVREIVKCAGDPASAGAADLMEVLQEITDSTTINRRKLGHWLRRHVGHIVGDLRLARVDVTRSSTVWKAEKL